MKLLPRYLHPVAAFAVGATLFAVLAAGTSIVRHLTGLEGMAVTQIALKSAMLVVAVAIMLLIGRPRPVWGFVAPRSWLLATLVPAAIGGGLGAAATAVIVGFGFAPMKGLAEMGLLRIITIIWFGSTLAEEIFVRGLVQGWMQPHGADDGVATPSASFARVAASGLLFGSFHLSLLFAGNAPGTSVTIVVATTLLGLVCAWSRERSGSLLGPLAAHLAFNVCGVIGGIAGVLLRALVRH